MPRYSGDVTLPDGRQFYGIVRFTPTERDTGASDMVSAEIYYTDGGEVSAEAQNEPLTILLPGYHDCMFVWEAVVELLTKQPPDDDEYDPGY